MNIALARERTEPDTTDQFVRELGAAERLFHLCAKRLPLHFCIVAEIAGQIDPDRLRDAFDAVQRRHPFLAASVIDDPSRGPSIVRSQGRIEADVRSAIETPDWRPIVEQKLTAAFASEPGPLMRATVLHEPARATIVLTFQHTLVDGLSGVYVVRDLMQALDGCALGRLGDPPPCDELVADVLLGDGRIIGPTWPQGLDADALRRSGASVLERAADAGAVVSTLSLDREATDTILRRSKIECTTLHDAICSALASSSAHRRDAGAFTVMNPISLRSALGAEGGDCALLLSAAPTLIPMEPPVDFWASARQVTRELAPARSPAGVLDMIEKVEACVPREADAERACGFFGLFGSDAVVSNLGALPIRTSVGSLQLEAIWGPIAISRVVDVVVGASSLDGVLRLVQASPRHVPSVLHEVRDRLAEACA